MSKEQFKCPREYSKAVECARTWRGLEPMLCYFFAKTYPKSNGKISRYTAAWEKHLMLSHVPDVSDDMQKSEFAAVGDVRCAWDKFITHATAAGLYVLRRTTSVFDLQWYMDGFTVYHCRANDAIGNIVFVRRGECLPVYVHEDCGQSPASKQVSKQHYFLVVGPGGVLVCCAMRSATTLSHEGQSSSPAKRKADDQFEFWYDLIPKMLAPGDLGDEDLEEVRCRMAGTRWVVCSPVHVWIPGNIVYGRTIRIVLFVLQAT